MSQITRFFPFEGGLDLVSPALAIPPGRVIGAVNYEPVGSGYKRVDGFERFDGRPKPSAASYWVLNFDAGTVAITAGDTVVGGTSGAFGLALFDATVQTGSYGGGDAAGFVVLTGVVGTFADDEPLNVSAAQRAVANGLALQRGATNDADDNAWLQAAITSARSVIAALPGTGPVLGVWGYGGDIYGFRGGGMYRATSSGWAAVALGSHIKFDAGTAEFAQGATLTGVTSGATATIDRVALRSGAWDGSGIGLLAISNITGTFQDNETITGGGGSATADGAVVANSLPAGGRYEFVNHNFFGASNLERMYGVNGAGHAFEWDGAVFVPIFTGMTVDTPKHVAVHKEHLFLGFPGGSAQHSGTGDPYTWSPVLGAAEIAIGQEITGFAQDVSGTLIILGRNRVAVLQGDDVSSWVLQSLANDAGAVEWTAQVIGNPIYLDDRGLRDMTTTSAFGDFSIGTITGLVEPIFALKRRAGVAVLSSVRSRVKNQYRLFWADGTGLIVYLGKKQPESMPINLGKAVRVVASIENAAGDEEIYFGSDDGFVYQMDSGTSFDGAVVEAYIRTAFNHVGAPTQNKRWHKATLELDATVDTQIAMIAEFGYANPDQPATNETLFSVTGGGGFWDDAIWDEFFWSTPVKGVAEAHLDGIGANISVVALSSLTFTQPHTIHGMTLHFSPRRLIR